MPFAFYLNLNPIGNADMNRLSKINIYLILSFSISGCSLPLTLNPPPANTQITELCIIDNPKVLMNGFYPELKRQIESYGIKTQHWTGYNPDGCRYWLDYTANWRWDLIMYLIYAELKLYDKQTLIGRAIFDNTGFGPRHYGSADEKLNHLTQALFDKNWKDPNLDQ
jgi:hypothetical protein